MCLYIKRTGRAWQCSGTHLSVPPGALTTRALASAGVTIRQPRRGEEISRLTTIHGQAGLWPSHGGRRDRTDDAPAPPSPQRPGGVAAMRGLTRPTLKASRRSRANGCQCACHAGSSESNATVLICHRQGARRSCDASRDQCGKPHLGALHRASECRWSRRNGRHSLPGSAVYSNRFRLRPYPQWSTASCYR